MLRERVTSKGGTTYAAITAMALVLLDMALLSQGGDRPLLSERIYDTALGCGIALLTTWVIFPSRWRGRSKSWTWRPACGRWT